MAYPLIQVLIFLCFKSVDNWIKFVKILEGFCFMTDQQNSIFSQVFLLWKIFSFKINPTLKQAIAHHMTSNVKNTLNLY